MLEIPPRKVTMLYVFAEFQAYEPPAVGVTLRRNDIHVIALQTGKRTQT